MSELTLKGIIEAVCKYYNVDPDALCDSDAKNTRDKSKCKEVVCLLCNFYFTVREKQLKHALCLNGKKSVYKARRRAYEVLEVDPEFRQEVLDIGLSINKGYYRFLHQRKRVLNFTIENFINGYEKRREQPGE